MKIFRLNSLAVAALIALAGTATAHAHAVSISQVNSLLRLTLSGNHQALRQLTADARSGDNRAQFYLGALYNSGRGVPRNYAKANYWLRKAASQGDALAENVLGVNYARGNGVPRNYAKADYWYEKAASQGDAWAENALGVNYARGNGVPQHYTEAVYWLRKAVAQGDALAGANLRLVTARLARQIEARQARRFPPPRVTVTVPTPVSGSLNSYLHPN